MIRFVLISLLVACAHPQAATTPQPAPAKVVEAHFTPAPPPPLRNFVCERVASEGNKKAICEPEYTGEGELLTHSARVTVDGITNVCTMNDRAPMLACVPLFYVPPQQPEEKPAKKAPAKKK